MKERAKIVECKKGQQKRSSEILSRYLSSPNEIMKIWVAQLKDW